MPNKLVWILVNSNTKAEAEKIGKEVLKKRLCACYALIPRIKSVYFWPPQSDKFESSRGPLLVLETLPENAGKISSLVKKLHSDRVPFIGQIEIGNLNKDFFNWLKTEIT